MRISFLLLFLRVLSLWLCTAAAPLSSLYSLLESVEYLNNGTVTNDDVFGYSLRNWVSYGEPENVTTIGKSWAIIASNFSILYKSDGRPIPPPTTCTLTNSYPQYDMPGGDMGSVALDHISVDQCEAFCCHSHNCLAFVVTQATQPSESCAVGDACCYLKSSIQTLVPSNDTGIIAGIVTSRQPIDPFSIHPPIGMRSGVPAGGISCGSIEMRADGTFHEWTIGNQSPAGSAKYGIIGEAVMAISIHQSQVQYNNSNPYHHLSYS